MLQYYGERRMQGGIDRKGGERTLKQALNWSGADMVAMYTKERLNGAEKEERTEKELGDG